MASRCGARAFLILLEFFWIGDPISDVTKAAIQGLELIYQPGFAFSKAEILLLEICQPDEYTPDLFANVQPAASQKVMQVMDQINAKWGRGTMRPGRVPVTPDWGMKREMLSPSYTG
ncbi:DUF4113 domain-containing protein [Pseudomonas brenneri]|uniref:DUF4113 domain-containing protein n=1 Tax=Pseudomonas brenneri TaxID=129817 RepID=UPI0009EC9429|nr:DUF4113 domain-containing protein [Pseudomonas brenneri]MBF8003220.1 DUF4113 domain-containing protein [Pseudomonas brenneri]